MARAATGLVVLGLVAASLLVWGGTRLQAIFAEERDAAEAHLTARQHTLAQYGLVALDRRLQLSMRQARPRIDAALSDPLQPDDGLFYAEGGVQRLPRLRRFLGGMDTPVSRLYEAIVGAGGGIDDDGDSVFGERLALLRDFGQVLEARSNGNRSGDDSAVVRSVRDILDHETRHAMSVTKELPYRVAFLERFIERGGPDRSLLEGLFRDGLRGSRGQRIEGLEPLLLASSEHFTRTDFDHMASRISELARTAGVAHDDFDASAASPPGEAVAVPRRLSFPELIGGGRWFVEPLEVNGVRGVAVELPVVLREIGEEMRAGGLLGSGDTLALDGLQPDAVPVLSMRLRANSASMAADRAEIAGRYRLKTATGVALLLLVVFVGALVALLYVRERRYLAGKASLVATMSHELRTPIASLRLMGETLERRLEGVEAARDFPSRIVKEADRLSFLVENVLSFNRLERTAVARNRTAISLSELVDEAQTSTDAFTPFPVEIRIDYGEELPLFVDGELARLLLSNLIHNSCKYNAGGTVKIRLGASLEAGRVVLRFTDNGTGIAKDEWERVFTEFVRARNAGAIGGFGLGLALCRRIMSLHDGSIRVADSSPSGTTFEMTFPTSPPGEQTGVEGAT